MSESHLPTTALSARGTSGWTGGRIVAVVIGAMFVLVSLGLLGGAGTALWADLTRRDAAGYVTSGAHEFSSPGSALATERIQLGSPGVGWLYSTVLLGEVRVVASPDEPGTELFVGIGSSADVDRYLSGVSHTRISDFWTDQARVVGGDAAGSAPASQDFWIASSEGAGAQTVTWEPTNGSWTVVVMNADGSAEIDPVTTELGATMPSLSWVGWVALALGAVVLVVGALLIAGGIRRAGRARSA